MRVYDYRISDEAVENISATINKLSNKDLLKLSESVEGIQQTQEDRLAKAKEYFDRAILPGLCDFAEMTNSVLYVEEYDERMSVQAVFKNPLGFDITESCRVMRSLIFLSNYIGIMTEDGDTELSLVYEYKEMEDYK